MLSRLYTNGCSLTYHTAIAKEDQWSAILGKMLDIPIVINDGQGCGSNERIFRRTYEYLQHNKEFNNETLFLIQLTWPFRFEYYQSDKTWASINQESVVCNDQTHGRQLLNLRSKYYTPEENSYRFLQQVTSLEYLFKSFDIKNYYFISAYKDDDESIEYIKFLDDNITWLYKTFHKSYYFHNLFTKISEADGHPDKEGNELIANWIAKGLSLRE